MLGTIVYKELHEHMHSLRFSIGFVLIVGLFSVNGFSWIVRYQHEMAQFQMAQAEREESLEQDPRIYTYATQFNVGQPPSPLAFVSGGNSRGLPNVAYLSRSEIWRFEQRGERNPLLFRIDLDWTFIIGLLGSLLALLLTHDSIAGEKERGTLRQILANPLPRDTLLWGKYLSVLIVLAVPILLGSLIALIIISWSNLGGVSTAGWAAVTGTLAAGLLCTSAFIWMGLFVSSTTDNPALALLLLLMTWSVLTVFIPSSGGLVGNLLAPVPRASEVANEVAANSKKRVEMMREEVPGERVEARKDTYNRYWNQLVHQIEVAQNVTRISPVSAFGYLGETLSGTGSTRYLTFLERVRQYRRQLEEFDNHKFTDSDGQYKHVDLAPEEVPRFVFRDINFHGRADKITEGFSLLLFFNLVFFAGAYWSFRRYDVR